MSHRRVSISCSSNNSGSPSCRRRRRHPSKHCHRYNYDSHYCNDNDRTSRYYPPPAMKKPSLLMNDHEESYTAVYVKNIPKQVTNDYELADFLLNTMNRLLFLLNDTNNANFAVSKPKNNNNNNQKKKKKKKKIHILECKIRLRRQDAYVEFEDSEHAKFLVEYTNPIIMNGQALQFRYWKPKTGQEMAIICKERQMMNIGPINSLKNDTDLPNTKRKTAAKKNIEDSYYSYYCNPGYYHYNNKKTVEERQVSSTTTTAINVDQQSPDKQNVTIAMTNRKQHDGNNDDAGCSTGFVDTPLTSSRHVVDLSTTSHEPTIAADAAPAALASGSYNHLMIRPSKTTESEEGKNTPQMEGKNVINKEDNNDKELQKLLITLQVEKETLTKNHRIGVEKLKEEIKQLNIELEKANQRCFQITDPFIEQIQQEKKRREKVENELKAAKEQMAPKMVNVKVEIKSKMNERYNMDDKQGQRQMNNNYDCHHNNYHTVPNRISFQDEIEFEI